MIFFGGDEYDEPNVYDDDGDDDDGDDDDGPNEDVVIDNSVDHDDNGKLSFTCYLFIFESLYFFIKYDIFS